jgi:hypothetical protein
MIEKGSLIKLQAVAKERNLNLLRRMCRVPPSHLHDDAG